MLVAQAARRSLTIATRDKSILRAALTATLKILAGERKSIQFYDEPSRKLSENRNYSHTQ